MTKTIFMPAASPLRVRPPYAGLAAVQACSAPTSAAHGTAVSGAGFSLIGAATADTQDVQGSPPREAPV